MKTCIVSTRQGADSMALWKAAQISDDYSVYKSYNYKMPSVVENPFVYGTMQFADVIAKQFNLKLLEPPLDFLANLSKNYPEYVKRDIQIMPHKDVHKVKSLKFIKPANDKVFVADLYPTGSDIPNKYIDPECPIIVSDVISLEEEFRCYVLDRKVVTASCYAWKNMLYEDNPRHTDSAKEFVENMLKNEGIKIPSSCVIDVGLVNEDWVVIEANQTYASGIYHEANLINLFPAIFRSSNCNVNKEDEPFVRNLIGAKNE